VLDRGVVRSIAFTAKASSAAILIVFR